VSKGGGAASLIVSGRVPVALAVDAAWVYWGDVSALWRMPLGGGASIPLVSAGWDEPLHYGFAVDASRVYFARASVWQAPIVGGAATALSPPDPFQDYGIAVDATDVYWVGGDPSLSASIIKVPIAGGPSTVLATGQSSGPLAVDDTYVYWMDVNHGMTRVPKGGGAVSTLPSTPLSLDDLVQDGAFLYYLNLNGVWRLPKDGGLPTLLSCSGGVALRVDATDVYWVGDGVWRMPK
jgi:hypothetical protein